LSKHKQHVKEVLGESEKHPASTQNGDKGNFTKPPWNISEHLTPDGLLMDKTKVKNPIAIGQEQRKSRMFSPS